MSTTYSLPEDALINVGATASPATPLNGMTNYTVSDTKNRTAISVFMNANKISNFGATEGTISFEGLYSADDPGQVLLRAAAISGDGVYVKLQPDGTNGRTCYMLVGSQTVPGDAENRPKQTFELAIEGSIANVDVGTGL